MADWKTISRSCDEEFWPTLETARQAYQAGLTIKTFALDHLPKEMKVGKV